ncbi:MAG: hypothetical protein ABIH42_05890, partial [Planctomycetota bacterium]
KIDFSLMKEIRKKVSELESKFPREIEVESSSYPHFYGNDMVFKSPVKKSMTNVGKDINTEKLLEGSLVVDYSVSAVIQVTGSRSLQFIQGVSSADFSNIAVGETKPTFLLDSKSQVIADVIVQRLEKDKRKRDRFLVIPTALNSQEVIDWLRHVSDGYVLFDEEDIMAKIEGPVVVEDLRFAEESGNKQIAFLVCGKKAKDTVTACSKMPEVTTMSCSINNEKLYLLLVTPEKADEVLTSLTKAGAESIGQEIIPALRKKLGLPDYSGDFPKAESLYANGLQNWFGENKFYFAGMKPLNSILKRETKKKEEFHWEEKESAELKKTAFFKEHAKLTKKDFLVPFAGWHMPVWYTRVSEEHAAVRNTAGIFDVSHMGLFEIKGEYATRFLDIVLSNYVPWFRTGQAFYAYALGPDGNIIDDTFTYKLADDWYYIIVNASNTDKMWTWFNGVNDRKYLIDRENPSIEVEGHADIRNLKSQELGAERKVNVALQGPNSLSILLNMISNEEEKRRLKVLPWSNVMWADISGEKCLIARTGYTGERVAFEIYVPWNFAVDFWCKTLEAGADFNLKPCGLGSRDSTRTEAGLPLYGHELAGPLNVSPIEAGYGAFVRFHKPFFIGRKAMMKNEKTRNSEIIRFKLLDKNVRTLHLGDPIASKRAKHVGYVTSSVLVDEYQIGMAYIDRKMNVPGTKFELFPVEASGAGMKEKQKSAIKPGDSLLFSSEAEVLTRWPIQE